MTTDCPNCEQDRDYERCDNCGTTLAILREPGAAPDPQPLDAQSLYDELNAVVQRACLQEGGAILAVDVIGTVLADIFHACPRRQRDDLIARLSDALRQGMKLAEVKGLIQ